MADEAAAPVVPVDPTVPAAAVLVPTGTIDPPAAPTALEQRIDELTRKLEALSLAKAVEAQTALPEAQKRCVAVRAWLKTKNIAGCANRFITGARTFLFFGTTGALGLADSFSGIDLSGLAEQYIGMKLKVGDLVTMMAVGGILLRLVTKTPAFTRWQKAATAGNDGIAPGVGSGSVDEPEEK